MSNLATCLQLAAQAGFTPARAQQACQIAGNESGYGTDTRCACAFTEGGTIYHDAECDQFRLTKHCGVLQMDVTNPLFQPVLNSGCGYDLACSLRALFDLSQGGNCFDHPNPWGPDVGTSYGTCAGNVTPATLAGAPAGGGASGGTATTAGLPGGNLPIVGGPITAINSFSDLLRALSNPHLWLRLGIAMAGILAIGVGLHALVATGAHVTVKEPSGG